MKCVDCPQFWIAYNPLKVGRDVYDSGLAICGKHNLEVEFTSRKKLNTLDCVEDIMQRMVSDGNE